MTRRALPTLVAGLVLTATASLTAATASTAVADIRTRAPQDVVVTRWPS